MNAQTRFFKTAMQQDHDEQEEAQFIETFNIVLRNIQERFGIGAVYNFLRKVTPVIEKMFPVDEVPDITVRRPSY